MSFNRLIAYHTLTIVLNMSIKKSTFTIQLSNPGLIGPNRLHQLYPLVKYTALYFQQYHEFLNEYGHTTAARNASLYMALMRAAARYGLHRRSLTDEDMPFNLPNNASEDDRRVSFHGHHSDLLDAVSSVYFSILVILAND
jgi:hypothetical protein